MPLTKVQIAPGFNKQVTATGAEGKWVDGDFVRFRWKKIRCNRHKQSFNYLL